MSKFTLNINDISTYAQALLALSSHDTLCNANTAVRKVVDIITTGGHNGGAMRWGADSGSADPLISIGNSSSNLYSNMQKEYTEGSGKVSSAGVTLNNIKDNVVAADNNITLLLLPLFEWDKYTSPFVNAKSIHASDIVNQVKSDNEAIIADINRQLKSIDVALEHCNDPEVRRELYMKRWLLNGQLAEATEKGDKLYHDTLIEQLKGMHNDSNFGGLPSIEDLATFRHNTNISYDELTSLLQEAFPNRYATSDGKIELTNISTDIAAIGRKEGELLKQHNSIMEMNAERQTIIDEANVKAANRMSESLFSSDDRSAYKTLPDDLKQAVEKGGMSVTQATEIARKRNEAATERFNSLPSDLKAAVTHGGLSMEGALKVVQERQANAEAKTAQDQTTDTSKSETTNNTEPKYSEPTTNKGQTSGNQASGNTASKDSTPTAQPSTNKSSDYKPNTVPSAQLDGNETEYVQMIHPDGTVSLENPSQEVPAGFVEEITEDGVRWVAEETYADIPMDSPTPNVQSGIPYPMGETNNAGVTWDVNKYDDVLNQYAEMTGRTPEQILANGEYLQQQYEMGNTYQPTAADIAHTNAVLATLEAKGALINAVQSGTMDINTANSLGAQLDAGTLSPSDVQTMLGQGGGNTPVIMNEYGGGIPADYAPSLSEGQGITIDFTSSVNEMNVFGGATETVSQLGGDGALDANTQQYLEWTNQSYEQLQFNDSVLQGTGDPNLDNYLKWTGQSYDNLMANDAERRARAGLN